MKDKNCPECGKKMYLDDIEGEDGWFIGRMWVCYNEDCSKYMTLNPENTYQPDQTDTDP